MKDIQACFQPCFLFLLILICFLLSLAQLSDQDTWLHLKTGEWIIENLKVPHEQIFSYSIEGTPWVDHSWLFQALLFIVFRFFGGINAIIFLKAIIVSLIIWVTIKRFLNKSGHGIFLIASWLFSALLLERTPVRPELISALLLVFYLYVLFSKKNLYWLLPVQCVWVNVHGYSIIGPALIFLFLLSEYVKCRIALPFNWNEPRYFNNRAGYGKGPAVLAIAVFLFLLSPYGISNLKYPFFAAKDFLCGVHNFYHVSELSSLNLTDILFTQKHVLLTWAVILYMISLLLNIKGINIFNPLVYSCFFFMCCAANRNTIFFAVALCFCILDNLKTENLQYIRRYFNFSCSGVLSIILAIFLGSWILGQQFFKFKDLRKGYIYDEDFNSKSYLLGIDARVFPPKAVDFIVENSINGPIFNSFEISGYLVWRLYPSHKIFIDARTELYGRKFLDEFMRSTIDSKKWEELDKRHKFNVAILDYGSTDVYYNLIKMLYRNEEWKLVFFRENVVIFLKNNSSNRDIILKHEIVLERSFSVAEGAALISQNKSLYPQFFVNRARFFVNAVNMPALALKDLKKAELVNPECYDIYQLRGYTYFHIKKYKEAEEAFIKSLEINPDIAEPYINLGSVAAEMGLPKKAYFFYKHALKLDKDNKAAAYNLHKLLGKGLR